MDRGFVLACYSFQQMPAHWGIRIVFLFKESLEMNLLQSPGRIKLLLLAAIETRATRGNTGIDGIQTPCGGGELAGAGRYLSYNLCICADICLTKALPAFFSLWRLLRWRKGGEAQLFRVWMFHTVAYSTAKEDGQEDAPAESRPRYVCIGQWEKIWVLAWAWVQRCRHFCSVLHCLCHCFGSDTSKQCPGPGVLPICSLDVAIWYSGGEKGCNHAGVSRASLVGL